MKTKTKILLLFLLFSFSAELALADPLLLSDAEMQKLQQYFPAQADSHFVWNGNPIPIALPLNQEKRLIFPMAVLPDLKNALMTDQLRIINDNKSLYLTALKPFATNRLYVTVPASGEVVLIDLSTSDTASNAAITIDLQHHQNVNAHLNGSSTITTPLFNNANSLFADDANNAAVAESDNYVSLIRFAWQQLYAPKTLLNNAMAISRAPMHTLPMLSTLIYGDKVYAHPVGSWVYNDTYVTAVELRNKYSHSTTLNLNRDVCGNWQAASLYPRTQLKPAGDKTGDSTVLFLISKKPFGDAMEVCNGSA